MTIVLISRCFKIALCCTCCKTPAAAAPELPLLSHLQTEITQLIFLLYQPFFQHLFPLRPSQKVEYDVLIMIRADAALLWGVEASFHSGCIPSWNLITAWKGCFRGSWATYQHLNRMWCWRVCFCLGLKDWWHPLSSIIEIKVSSILASSNTEMKGTFSW